MRRIIVCFFAFTTALLLATVAVVAQATTTPAAEAFIPYRWADADLALLVPANWTAASAVDGDTLTLSLTPSSAGDTARALVRVAERLASDAEVNALLTSSLRDVSLQSSNFTAAFWLGQPAVNSEYGTTRAIAGRLPDGRLIALVAGAASGTQAEALFTTVRNSLVFSAVAAPTSPQYSLVWQAELPAPVESPFDAPEPRIAGLDIQNERVFAVDAARGVLAFDATTGNLLATYPFPNPAQPTGLSVGDDGTIYVGDAVCRCVQVLGARGDWRDPVGAFAGNAPVQVIAIGGTVYAVDIADSAYLLRAITPPHTRDIPLNFNAVAAPLLLRGENSLYLLETLQSLLDNTTSRAFLQLGDVAPELVYWLPDLSASVSAAALDGNGRPLLALADGRIIQMNDAETPVQIALDAPEPRALAYSEDRLFIARADGTLIARNRDAPPERTGDGTLLPDVPYQGIVSAAQPVQSWTFSASAGQVVNIAATDLQRRDTLDVALRLFAPSGAEIAFNDDQLGVDLYGVFDPQIDDFALPEDGSYRVDVEYIKGDGIYTLGYTADRPLPIREDRASEFTGILQDALPVQRWTFSGRAGEAFTVTMFAESGDLDPALELLNPDGSTLAYNDDTIDPQMGVNAQLVRVEIPADGAYVLEASRFDGTGRYRIVITPNG